MMRKIDCYLESSALWNLYYNEVGSSLVESCLDHSQFQCISSHWSHLEITRGIKKRENQDELSSTEADQLQLFIDTDLKSLENKKKLILEQVTSENLQLAKRIIKDYNMYASDALHLATALNLNCEVILVDDYHFKRLDTALMKKEGLLIFSTLSSFAKLKSIFKVQK